MRNLFSLECVWKIQIIGMLKLLLWWRAPPHPALSPRLGERGRVRGPHGKQLNTFVMSI
jgi:hypothetical protein